MSNNNILDNVYFKELEVGTLTASNAHLVDANVAAGAAIATSKQVNRLQCVYAQMDGANVANTTGEGVGVYKCDKSAGATIKKVSAFCNDCGSGGSPAWNIAIEVKKWDESGSTLGTILSAAANITESTTDYETVNGTLADTDMDQGDALVVQVAVTGSGGTAPQGLCVQVEVDEAGS